MRVLCVLASLLIAASATGCTRDQSDDRTDDTAERPAPTSSPSEARPRPTEAPTLIEALPTGPRPRIPYVEAYVLW